MDKNERYVFAPGSEGFALVESGQLASSAQVQDFLKFCRSIAWRSTKLDHPDAACLVTFESRSGYWVCAVEEAGRDQYGRGLALRVTGQCVQREFLRDALQNVGSEVGVSLSAHDGDDVPCAWGATAHLILPPSILGASNAVGEDSPNSGSGLKASGRQPDLNKSRAVVPSDASSYRRSFPVFTGLVVGAILGFMLSYLFGLRPMARELEGKTRDFEGLEQQLRESLLHDAVVSPEAVRYAVKELRDGQRSAKAAAGNAEALAREWERAAGLVSPEARSPEGLREGLRRQRRRIEEFNDSIRSLAGDLEVQAAEEEEASASAENSLRKFRQRLRSLMSRLRPNSAEGDSVPRRDRK